MPFSFTDTREDLHVHAPAPRAFETTGGVA
jgi:hypothetical protein